MSTTCTCLIKKLKKLTATNQVMLSRNWRKLVPAFICFRKVFILIHSSVTPYCVKYVTICNIFKLSYEFVIILNKFLFKIKANLKKLIFPFYFFINWVAKNKIFRYNNYE